MAQDAAEDSYASMVVAVILILALLFAGFWIYVYASTGTPPWGLAQWFAGIAVLVVVAGIAWFARRGPT